MLAYGGAYLIESPSTPYSVRQIRSLSALPYRILLIGLFCASKSVGCTVIINQLVPQYHRQRDLRFEILLLMLKP